MIKANIEAQIKAKITERDKVWKDINRIDSLIEKLNVKKSRLLDLDTDLCYEMQDLADELNNVE